MRIGIGRAALAACALALVCGLGCVAGVSHESGSSAGSEQAVRDFFRRFGHESGSGILLLFADTARFELAGLNVAFIGREDIRHLVEYGVEAGSKFRPSGLSSSGDTVTCSLEETNNWLELLGVSRCRYDGWFVVSGARIVSARIGMTPESAEEIGGRFASFVVWLQGRDPRALNRLLPGGRPAYNAGAARELRQRLAEWRAGSR
jgi:hypothetical protein